MKRLGIAVILAFAPGLAWAEEGGGGEEAEVASDSSEAFDYDDGSGSVTVVEYSGGSQDIHRAAREGRTLTLAGVRGRRRSGLGRVPEYHRVVHGDTLWDLSRHYFSNPWHWPRVWSYNPDITNPNWIYPGDRIRLLPQGEVVPVTDTARAGVGWSVLSRARPGTIYLRSRGFVDHEVLETSGTIVGSREEVEMLAEEDECYVEFDDDDDVHIGEEYTVFRADESVSGVRGSRRDLGTFVEIFGTVRVVSYDEDSDIARGVITESINPIERGFRVGPIERRFEVIPPVQNEVDLEGYIVATFDPIQVVGEHHVVFVDRGREDGVAEGNRLFVLRRRDMYRETRDEPDDRAGYPFEILAELRVVEVRDRTATCLVTRSVTDIRVGDRFEMRRGY